MTSGGCRPWSRACSSPRAGRCRSPSSSRRSTGRAAQVLGALEHLARIYEREGRGLRLVQVAGGWQLRTPAEHGPWVRRLLHERPPRLSRPMLETLAIVAYRQPCTHLEIEAVRGVD